MALNTILAQEGWRVSFISRFMLFMVIVLVLYISSLVGFDSAILLIVVSGAYFFLRTAIEMSNRHQ